MVAGPKPPYPWSGDGHAGSVCVWQSGYYVEDFLFASSGAMTFPLRSCSVADGDGVSHLKATQGRCIYAQAGTGFYPEFVQRFKIFFK